MDQLSINSSVQFAPGIKKQFPVLSSTYLRSTSGDVLTLEEPSIEKVVGRKEMSPSPSNDL
jgi:hypothetical protein